MERREALEAAVQALEENYREHQLRSTLQYTEGYMDALAVVRAELAKNLTPRCCRVCRAMKTSIH